MPINDKFGLSPIQACFTRLAQLELLQECHRRHFLLCAKSFKDENDGNFRSGVADGRCGGECGRGGSDTMEDGETTVGEQQWTTVDP